MNEVERLNKEIERLNKEIKDLKEHYIHDNALLRHEVRNPLVNIGGYAMRAGNISNQSLICLEELSSLIERTGEADRMLELIEKLENYYSKIEDAFGIIGSETKKAEEVLSYLEFEDFEHGIRKLRKRKLDMMKDIIIPVMSSLNGEVSKRNAVIRYDTCMKEGEAILCADDYACRILYKNLIANALGKVPQRGMISFGVEDKGNLLKLNVYNDGHPIPPENLEKIFEAGHTEKETRGHGLGLSIARKIVEQHGGEIYAEFGRRHGANIIFTMLKE